MARQKKLSYLKKKFFFKYMYRWAVWSQVYFFSVQDKGLEGDADSAGNGR